jgi:hypothetical protein
MDSVSLLREQVRAAHEYLDETMADVTAEQAQWAPPGKATPLGANYLHLIQTEDMIINGALQKKQTLAESTWAGKIGASEPMPTPPWEEADYFAWSRRVQVDLPQLREYGKAVYAASDDYMATLSPDDLGKTADLSSLAMSPVTVAWVLSRYVAGHADNICGEASCLKGLQGAKGYAE